MSKISRPRRLCKGRGRGQPGIVVGGFAHVADYPLVRIERGRPPPRRDPLAVLLGAGGAVAGIALRPVATGVELGLRGERELRAALLRRAQATALAGLDAFLASEFATEVADRLLERMTEERAVARVLEGPELERVVASALDSAAMERLVVRVIDSRLLEEAVDRLLKSEELWLIVDEIARSPSVTEAITHQSVGFVDEVADGVRVRSRKADDRIESRIRRVFGRRPRPDADGAAG
jgi:hypothetical protein